MRKIELFTVNKVKVGEFLSLEQMKHILKELDFTEELDLFTIKEEIKIQLLQLQRRRLNQILDTYGYISLSDVQFYANQTTPDQEAVALLNWYSSYDDLIWQYIDNDLTAFTNIDELLQIDIKNIEQKIFEQSIKVSPLP